MKRCQYCAEEIQDEAILCRFCDRRQDEVLRPSVVRHVNRWLLAGALLVLVGGAVLTALARRPGRELQPRCAAPVSITDWVMAEKNGCDLPAADVCARLTVGGLLLASQADRTFQEVRQERGEAGAIMAAVELVRTQRRRARCAEPAPDAPQARPVP